MAEYRFEVVAKYSEVITVETDTYERAYDLALESAPGWIDIGGKMAYVEDVQAYSLEDE